LDLDRSEVLIIEDEDLMAALIQRYVQQLGQESGQSFKTLRLPTGWSLLTSDLSSVKIAVVDILLPQVNGADLIRHFRSHYPRIGVVPVTGMATSQLRRQIKDSLPAGFEILDKPLRKSTFWEAFQRAQQFNLNPPPLPNLPTVEKASEEALWTSSVAASIPTAQFKKKIPGRKAA
jgi:response regulator of citrate/malate metabolism